MRPHRDIPIALDDAGFSYSEAREAGLTRDRLRVGDIAHPHHGVYTTAPAGDLVARCKSLATVMAGHHRFSHVTAARLWGIPLPHAYSPEEDLHVIAADGEAPMRRPGVVGWETAQAVSSASVDGLPVVAPAQVWCQLATPGVAGVRVSQEFGPARDGGYRLAERRVRQSLSPEDLVAAGDFLLSGSRADHPRHQLSSPAELAAAAEAWRGKRGVLALEWALPRLRAGVDSPGETRLRLGLMAEGLPEPEIQVEVRTSRGIRHADLGYAASRVLIEYQGDQHRTSRDRWLQDLTRVQLFQDAGYHVIPVGHDDVVPDCRALAARIRPLLTSLPPV